MTMKQKELFNIIEALPEELSIKVLDYIEYLKFSNATNNAPEELRVKDKKDLREKLEKDPTNPEIIVTVRGIGYKLGEENAKR